jgi:hypothetical protein
MTIIPLSAIPTRYVYPSIMLRLALLDQPALGSAPGAGANANGVRAPPWRRLTTDAHASANGACVSTSRHTNRAQYLDVTITVYYTATRSWRWRCHIVGAHVLAADVTITGRRHVPGRLRGSRALDRAQAHARAGGRGLCCLWASILTSYLVAMLARAGARFDRLPALEVTPSVRHISSAACAPPWG